MIKAIPRSKLRDTLYPDYYDYWVSVYKEGVVAERTYDKWAKEFNVSEWVTEFK